MKTEVSMPDLGKALSQARIARGLTLQDAERDTRISRRYLEALEREDFRAFPAPVYTRAFLRTYAQYLGLNPAQMMALLPHPVHEPELRPLPEVPKPTASSFSANWLVAAGAILFLVIAGVLFLGRGSNSHETPQIPSPPAAQAEPAVQPQTLGPVVPGETPNFDRVELSAALGALNQIGANYVVIETARPDVPKGLVVEQNPAPGTKIGPEQSVTLLVSR